MILPGFGGAPGKRIEALTLEASMPAPDATLAVDGSATPRAPDQAAGSIGVLAQLLDGEAVPLSLDIDAPSYLEEKAALNGIASYKGDSFVFSQFTARAGRQIVGRQRQLQRQPPHAASTDLECERQ